METPLQIALSLAVQCIALFDAFSRSVSDGYRFKLEDACQLSRRLEVPVA